ncbi:MAG TPA: hypothetical protein DEF41_06735 [Desulfovibrio sp.]|uniref:Uncharacterized protein n=1 Tax=Nitratidesulfovibrio vulgaris (strain ATCC 29579 / DSM 644 / CCUG 34227 / NCIMB 8303 / VKM B-1760 / Hildenborough) TaxID=882 RepID=Q72C99_NITV2|nr:hypothetical protein DVU_1385 [Nitratidesulfovibrio vulgaris str. Hildenborough]HBW15820.1 hypothetical protein [Desulfovibrio sp.]
MPPQETLAFWLVDSGKSGTVKRQSSRRQPTENA